MSIDQFTDKINIKDLLGLEPLKKSGLGFDPRREITATDWSNIQKEFRDYDPIRNNNAKGYEDDFFQLAESVKVISPDKLPHDISDHDYRTKIIERISVAWNAQDYRRLLALSASAVSLYPDISEATVLNPMSRGGEVKRFIGRNFHHAMITKDDHDLSSISDYLSSLKRFAPSRMQEFENFDRLGTLLLSACNKIQDNSIFEKKHNLLLDMASSLRVLFPELFNELKIKDEYWDLWREKLDRSRGIPHIFAKNIEKLVILGASDIHMDGRSINLTFDKQIAELYSEKPLPETRKF